MSNQHLPFDCTSAGLEKEVIERFRQMLSFLNPDCQIFREPWDHSTVLCLNFADCPHLLATAQQQAPRLVRAAQQLGLAKAVVFRLGNKFRGWAGNGER